MKKMLGAAGQALRPLASMWLTVIGLALVTWGVCLFLLPLGLICGGLCAVLLDWYTDQLQGGDE